MSIIDDLKPSPHIGNLEPIKCNCQAIDENLCDELLENIKRELEADRPKDFKVYNIKRMIKDFYN